MGRGMPTSSASVKRLQATASVVAGNRLARAQTLGSILGPRLRLGDLRQVYVDLLVGDAVEQMPDQVQPGAALVVGRDDVPGRPGVWVASIMRW